MEKKKVVLFLVCCAVFMYFAPGMTSYATAGLIFGNENGSSVQNKPLNPTQFTLTEPKIITYIRTYHWNGGTGTPPGTISLIKDGKTLYTAQSSLESKYYWAVKPNLVFPAGTYTVNDSSAATWSHNSQSGGRGFVTVNGDPVPDDRKGPVVAHFKDVEKGPVPLSSFSAPPAPYLTIDKKTIKMGGEKVTVRVMNALPVPAGFDDDLYNILVDNHPSIRCADYCQQRARCPQIYFTCDGVQAGTHTIRIRRMGLKGGSTQGSYQVLGPVTLTVVP